MKLRETREDKWVKNETGAAEARRYEARAIMSLVDDSLNVALRDLEALTNIEEVAAQTEVPEAFLDALGQLQEASGEISRIVRRLSAHMVTQRGINKARVAEAAGVTPMTVWRWVKEHQDDEQDGYKDRD